ncbi:hypothetical protein MNBD_PLANCTO03-1941 [hydrothermal vent metagenome]|uniref:Zinc ribbon domain-containing protein n=1 Tax=hydrothermal vent metagenome TaxID=652676 RepID=A0A3B1E528_9ZZZZ
MTGETDTRKEMLRVFLAEHDAPCPACGYNLRGLTEATCPECGEALRLQVGMVEPRMKLYLTGLIGLAFGLGFDSIILLWMLFESLVGGMVWFDFFDAFPLLVGFVVCGGAMACWLWFRRWIRHRSIAIRLGLVVGCWALSAGAGVAFFAVVA